LQTEIIVRAVQFHTHTHRGRQPQRHVGVGAMGKTGASLTWNRLLTCAYCTMLFVTVPAVGARSPYCLAATPVCWVCWVWCARDVPGSGICSRAAPLLQALVGGDGGMREFVQVWMKRRDK
jgi:hypothetical protein